MSRKFFGDIFGMGITGHKLELIEADSGGDLLYGTAKWSVTGKAKGADQPWGGVRPTSSRNRPRAASG